jgi:VWFA-related protein
MRSSLAFLVTAALLRAQQPAPQEETTIRTIVQLVLVPVAVMDKSGNFVVDLKPQDFELYDNGKKQKIQEDVLFHPLSLVIAVQANAAMEKILPQVQKLGGVFDGLVTGETGEAAVLAFDHRVQTLQEFTNRPGATGEALKRIKPGSSTSALNDATLRAISMLKNRPKDRRRTLVLIAEPRDGGSESSLREVLTEAELHQVTIYSLNVSRFLTALTGRTEPPRPSPIPPGARHLPGPGGVNTPTYESQNQMGSWVPALAGIFKGVRGLFVANVLETYTGYTGGREYSFLNYRDLEKAVAGMGAEIHNQYLLSYSPSNLSEAGYHEIEVRVRRGGLSIRARPGYWAAGVPVP